MLRSAVVACTLLFLVSAGFAADTKTSTPSGGDDTKAFYTALSEYFKIPLVEIMAAHEQRIPDEELAVAIFIAIRAGIRPDAVIQVRKLGRSWNELASHFGVSPDQFYTSVNIDACPPFGKALGHFKKYPKKEWNKIEFDDEDIINLVNLKFVSNYYRVPVEDVVKLRCKGKAFIGIFKEVKPQPQEDKGKADRAAKREEMRKKAQAKK